MVEEQTVETLWSLGWTGVTDPVKQLGRGHAPSGVMVEVVAETYNAQLSVSVVVEARPQLQVWAGAAVVSESPV